MSNPNNNTGWGAFAMMGTNILHSSDGDLVVGTPMATPIEQSRFRIINHYRFFYDNFFNFHVIINTPGFSWSDERHPGHLFRVRKQHPYRQIVPQRETVAWGDVTHSTDDEPHTYDMTGTAIVRGNATLHCLLFPTFFYQHYMSYCYIRIGNRSI